MPFIVVVVHKPHHCGKIFQFNFSFQQLLQQQQQIFFGGRFSIEKKIQWFHSFVSIFTNYVPVCLCVCVSSNNFCSFYSTEKWNEMKKAWLFLIWTYNKKTAKKKNCSKMILEFRTAYMKQQFYCIIIIIIICFEMPNNSWSKYLYVCLSVCVCVCVSG